MSKPKSRSPALAVPVKVRVRRPRKKKAVSQDSVPLLHPYLEQCCDPMRAPLAARPDLNDHAVVVWREELAYTITPNAQGDFWHQFSPVLYNTIQKFTIDAAGLVATGTTNVSVDNYTELSTTFAEYRPLAAAVEAKYIGRSDEAKGVLMVCKHTPGVAVGDKFSMLLDEPSYEECSVADPGASVAAKLCDHKSEEFAAVTGSPVVDPARVIAICGTGLPVTACIRVRYSLVFEATVSHSKLLANSAKHSPSDNRVIGAAGNIIGPKSSVAAGPDAYEKLVHHSKKLAALGAELHGLYTISKPYLADLAALIM